MERAHEFAVFAGGCFWCTEAVFQRLRGVVSAVPGYSGGSVADPTYEQVAAGNTGHAEAVKIEFDPTRISYSDLLDVFFGTHDPTTANRQGDDVGPQYRSVIFYLNEGQREAAESAIVMLGRSGAFDKPIVTTIEPFKEFYIAEDYHRNYYKTHRSASYCQIVIDPKMAKLRAKFESLLE